jgi:DNA-binding CsgD family transcriptional regulator
MNEPHLSDRERTVLLLAAEGLTDKEIARKLGLSHKTIGTYWDRMREKFSASSRTQVLAQFLRIQLGENVLDGEFCLKLFSEWHDGVWVLDKDANTVYANQVAMELFGAREELTPSAIGQANAARVKKLLASSRTDASTVEVQYSNGGGLKHLQLRAMPFRDGQGRAAATLVHIEDLSHLRQLSRSLASNEAALTFLMEHAGDCVARFDGDLKVTHVNPALCEIHGAQRGDLLGLPVSDLGQVFSPNDRWLSNLSKALKTGRAQKFSAELPGISRRVPTHILPDGRRQSNAPCLTSVARSATLKKTKA